MSEHTPLPWAVAGTTLYSPRGIQPHIAYFRDGDNNPLTKVAEANAMFVCGVVNSHAALVGEMKWIREQIAKVPIHQTTALEEEIFKHVHAALRDAGETI